MGGVTTRRDFVPPRGERQSAAIEEAEAEVERREEALREARAEIDRMLLDGRRGGGADRLPVATGPRRGRRGAGCREFAGSGPDDRTQTLEARETAHERGNGPRPRGAI